jgi:outer membrane protein OmpA-like peptidoglycan-associated protein
MLRECKIQWIGCLLLLPVFSTAQKGAPIVLSNPSFEDVAKHSVTPTGWYNCGKSEESPPDIQPGSFSVTKTASNGSTYMGLVVRDNETWEGVAQRLGRPLEANQCYEFSMDLCRAELYLSVSKTTNEQANYATPAKVRIWGGNGYCDYRELLFETSIIANTRWLGYNFRLSPKKGNFQYIIIEAYFKTPVLFPYNGNVLIDNISPIRQLGCNPEAMPVDLVKKTPPKPGATIAAKGDTNKTKAPPVASVKPTPAPPAPEPATAINMDRKVLKKGSIIRLDKVYFETNKYEIMPASESALSDLLDFLKDNPDVVVEVGGHTSNNPTDKYAEELSTNRAKSVADWLTAQGISTQRVQYKGYGKTQPIMPNTNVEGRRRNQRVEIKILSMNG